MLENYVTESVLVHVDSSPPMIENVCLRKAEQMCVAVHDSRDLFEARYGISGMESTALVRKIWSSACVRHVFISCHIFVHNLLKCRFQAHLLLNFHLGRGVKYKLIWKGCNQNADFFFTLHIYFKKAADGLLLEVI